MLYKTIRYCLLVIIVIAIAIIAAAAFSMPADAAQVKGSPCLKPAAHHRRHAPVEPVQSCMLAVAPPLMCYREPNADIEPIALDTTRYAILDTATPTDEYTPTLGGYWEMSGPAGGGFAIASVNAPTVNVTVGGASYTTTNTRTSISTVTIVNYPLKGHAPCPPGDTHAAPEIDPANLASGFTLLAGLLAVARGRIRA